jgi:Na+(H+)/acetate symporter ActP
MSARLKLNQVYLNACLLVAAVVGLIAQSWVAFLVTMAVLVGIGCADGAIRPQGRRQ